VAVNIAVPGGVTVVGETVSPVEVGACPSVTLSGDDADPSYVELPPYVAITGYFPGACPFVLAENVPAPPLRFADPSSNPSTAKLTLPVGVPLEPDTVAFSATLCPTVGELGVAVTVVVELDFCVPLTVSVANPDSCPPQVSAYVYVPSAVGVIVADPV
jgi:hypothetical protein